MAFRFATSTMQLLVVHKGGANTEDPNPNLWAEGWVTRSSTGG